MNEVLRYIPDWVQNLMVISLCLLLWASVLGKVWGEYIGDLVERHQYRREVKRRYLRRKAYRESQEVQR